VSSDASRQDASVSEARGPDHLERARHLRCTLRGPLGEYIRNVSDNWLKVAPRSNPAMLAMFRDRDRMPLRDLLPWSGEFAGKYLTSAVEVYRLTRDATLRTVLDEFVADLVGCQDADGYIGPWPRGSRLTGSAPNVFGKDGATWDAWGHYHVMLGLLLWHEETGDTGALRCVTRAGDLFCRLFLDGERRLVETGSTEMNLAVLHALCLLYARTGTRRYLKLAERIVEEFATEGPDGPLAGDYVRCALDGKAFHEMPRPRWESLHPIMGIADLYRITGDARLREVFERIWWSIVAWDRHNNGGFGSGEKACGNPYDPGAIETCSTVAWISMSVEMLRLTGSSIVADEIELSTLNSIIGLHDASGRWVTYDTPMDGVRRASTDSISFQARPGSPELNCCSVNAARGFGLLSDWALMQAPDGVVMNYCGPCRLKGRLHDRLTVELEQQTDYPRSGRIRITIRPSRSEQFTVYVRVPSWSARSAIAVNGQRVRHVEPGTYCRLERTWRRGDTIDLRLDMSPYYWVGQRQVEGKTSLYRGPILLTCDRRLNNMNLDEVPALDAANMKLRLVRSTHPPQPIVLVQCRAGDGRVVRLCDFGSAGATGSCYRSWLEIRNAPSSRFSRTNPLRSARLG
jgi:DUF1680 family protein